MPQVVLDSGLGNNQNFSHVKYLRTIWELQCPGQNYFLKNIISNCALNISRKLGQIGTKMMKMTGSLMGEEGRMIKQRMEICFVNYKDFQVKTERRVCRHQCLKKQIQCFESPHQLVSALVRPASITYNWVLVPRSWLQTTLYFYVPDSLACHPMTHFSAKSSDLALSFGFPSHYLPLLSLEVLGLWKWSQGQPGSFVFTLTCYLHSLFHFLYCAF